ncbi:hypothetical protein AMTR_s00016p00239760 [Amborella trichopoda]|uniref:Uncharacterized protein n=1 Tax=Amborella trichopoda TaxID=13333 RepID=W1P8Y7_AMBTC|nr:hypothetical protein AMTR_s00016p00239760 [Amborella trichopoda]
MPKEFVHACIRGDFSLEEDAHRGMPAGMHGVDAMLFSRARELERESEEREKGRERRGFHRTLQTLDFWLADLVSL